MPLSAHGAAATTGVRAGGHVRAHRLSILIKMLVVHLDLSRLVGARSTVARGSRRLGVRLHLLVCEHRVARLGGTVGGQVRWAVG